DAPWDAYRVTPPSRLPASIRPSAPGTKWSQGTSGPGYEIRSHSFAQFAEWLESELGRPVVVAGAPEGKYDFVVEASVFDSSTIVAWLKDSGFAVESTAVARPTVTVSSAQASDGSGAAGDSEGREE
ncbi:MAG: hypothetical protein ACYTFI_08665, partial [Planctomycetota bacterium]